MQQDLHYSQKQSFTLTESGSYAVPGSLQDLLDQHGVDIGADSRLHYARTAAKPLTIASVVLACLGICQGVAMAFADGWSLLPTSVAVLAGLAMAAASVRLSRMGQEDTGTGIAASLAACLGMVLFCAAVPDEAILGIHLQQPVAYAFLGAALIVVAAGFVQRHGPIGMWSRSAAPVAALAATLAAMA